jgi:hypothetical protein
VGMMNQIKNRSKGKNSLEDIQYFDMQMEYAHMKTKLEEEKKLRVYYQDKANKLSKKIFMQKKIIIVKWVAEKNSSYGIVMHVIKSNHERFRNGIRFDYKFLTIAAKEGYTIISLPMDKLSAEKY